MRELNSFIVDLKHNIYGDMYVFGEIRESVTETCVNHGYNVEDDIVKFSTEKILCIFNREKLNKEKIK